MSRSNHWSLSCFVLLYLASQATSQNVSYVSFSGDIKCSSIPPASAPNLSGPRNFATDSKCDSIAVPSAWQRGSPNSTEEYDLVVVGAGSSGVYMIRRIYEEFEKQGRTQPTIALVERASWTGGRLISAFGGGALNLAAIPTLYGSKNASLNYPMPEYGGMRIDPSVHKLVYNKVMQVSNDIFGEGSCKPISECETSENCCKQMLTRMEVGNIRYKTVSRALGSMLASSNVSTPSQVYSVEESNLEGEVTTMMVDYHLNSTIDGTRSPFDHCIALAAVAEFYYNNITYYSPDGSGVATPATWKIGIDNMCSPTGCAKLTNLCDLCSNFPDPAAAILSCIGYDVDPATTPYTAVAGMAHEVVNEHDTSRLYLFNIGIQTFLQQLLFSKGNIPIAPMYEKQLNGIQIKCGNANALALAQTKNVGVANKTSVPCKINVTATTPAVTLNFADGSVVTAKTAYLTMLPYDMAALDGLKAWQQPLQLATNVNTAAKLVLSWKNPAEAPAQLLGLTPCVPGPCQRVILDGPRGWVVRQVWLWDPSTIMIYNTGYPETNGTAPVLAVNSMSLIAREQGMQALIDLVTSQLREAFDLPNLVTPEWARLKVWLPGSVLPGWNFDSSLNTTAADFAAAISRPLGDNTPVYYGNSEAAADGSTHGWIEGAFQMAEDSLASIMAQLGADPPEKIDKSENSNTSPSVETTPNTSGASLAMMPLNFAFFLGIVSSLIGCLRA